MARFCSSGISSRPTTTSSAFSTGSPVVLPAGGLLNAHYRMKAFYTIHTPEQYLAWLDEEVAAVQQ
jgi:hypothetical protein